MPPAATGHIQDTLEPSCLRNKFQSRALYSRRKLSDTTGWYLNNSVAFFRKRSTLCSFWYSEKLAWLVSEFTVSFV